MSTATHSGSNRIAGAGRLTPAKTVRFTFDGQNLTGLEGDTVASALLANGIHLVGRSFKYHRPRGILSAGSEEPNALVDIERDKSRKQPNVRATVQEIYDGLKVKSQNRWPSLTFDVGAVNDVFSPMLPAGFYYKTFMWPKFAWKTIYEPKIRAAAGLGVVPGEADTDRYSNRFAHCDVLVVGAGVAGLAAALSAASTGARVILCDEQPEAGGALRYESDVVIDGVPGHEWAAATVAKLQAMENVTVLTRTTAFGYYAQNFVGLVERLSDHLSTPAAEMPRERLWQVRAKKVILATGAIERHMVFANNDRPGVMLASAARMFLNQYGVAVGRKVGVYTANDSAYAAAIDLKRAGIDVPVIVDTRDNPNSPIVEQARSLGIEVLTGHAVYSAGGKRRVSSMSIKPVRGGNERKVAVDALIMSAGWTPSVHLFSQSRGKVAWDAANERFLPGTYAQDCVSVGACNGTDGLQATLDEAFAAGGGKASSVPATGGANWIGGMIGSAPGAGADTTVKAFVDFQNDVTAKDVRLAVREGMHSIEHVKRFTTNGMATDQGKTSNLHGLAIAAEALNRPIPAVGLTTFRAPFTPVTFGAIVNHARHDLFDPTRRTPMHAWHAAQGAEFEDVGQWKRAWYYPQAGEDMHTAVNRECVAVRNHAGIFDASTLGKIEVVGPDAAKFLELLYTNPWEKLGVGRLRYGIMLREDGFIYDDGVVGRLAEDRFHVTTTTGGAPRVMNHMEDYLQTEFPHLNVWLTSTHRTMGGDCRAGSESPRDHRAAGRRHRYVQRGHAAYERSGRQDLRRPDPFVPHVVYGRGGLRNQRAGRLWSGCMGSRLQRRQAAGTDTLWHRSDAYPACRKGLHHRRSGHGRNRHSSGCRVDLGHRQEQDGLCRHSRPPAPGPRGGRPQATRRPQDSGSDSGPGRGRADRRQSEPASADDHDWACDIVLLV